MARARIEPEIGNKNQMQKSSRTGTVSRRSRHRAGLPVVSQPYYPDVQNDPVQNFFKAFLLPPLP